MTKEDAMSISRRLRIRARTIGCAFVVSLGLLPLADPALDLIQESPGIECNLDQAAAS